MPSNSNDLLSASASASSYLSYPVRHAVSGVFRRLLSEPGKSTQNHPPPEHKDPCFSSPSQRSSPFQPPPLSPLALFSDIHTVSSSGHILSRQLAEEIRLLVPPRLQLIDSWTLLFNLDRDGSSIATLYEKSEVHRGTRNGFVLVIKDGLGSVFGAYLSEPLFPSGGHYYGNGECFLWRAFILSTTPTFASLPPPPSTDTTNLQRMTTISGPRAYSDCHSSSLVENSTDCQNATCIPEKIRFKAFPYSGINDYLIFCEHRFISVGGGDGHYGLWVDASLERGISSSCPTFGNEPLSDEGSKFEIVGFEVWKVGN